MASHKIKKYTEDMLSTTTDLMLSSIFFSFEFAFSAQGGIAAERAQETLSEISYDTIKRSLYQLKKRGYVSSENKITVRGKQRLDYLFPKYRSKRRWDGKLYLITYDFPVQANKKRNSFRRFLKKLGCAMLQHSVWITPYNPKALVSEFVDILGIEKSFVIVSSVGKDGSVGAGSMEELVEEVFNLRELNKEYENFIKKVKDGRQSRKQMTFSFLSILSKDPQLPFELLPSYWEGDEAYRIYKSSVHVHT